MTLPSIPRTPAALSPEATPGAAGASLGAPPPDVQRLLEHEHSPLPLYYDAQRAAALAASQRDWPQLWRLWPAGR